MTGPGDESPSNGGGCRARLEEALERGEIWPAFQPIVDLRTGRVGGYEVLARWTDPQGEQRSPLEFIPHFDRHGLLNGVLEHLVTRACAAAASWPGRFSLAFNVAPSQLVAGALPSLLANAAAVSGFPLSRIEIEVTEGPFAFGEERALAVLAELSGLGVQVAIDDFGTGHSNLARLEALRVQKLKIDARFVSGLDADSSKQRIVAATIGLGHSLDLAVVAEGVETEQEARMLAELGCDLGQGWLFGRPATGEAARRILVTRGDTRFDAPPLDDSPLLRSHHLESLYEIAPVGLCFVDLGFRFVKANKPFAALFGRSPAELEGRSLHQIPAEGPHELLFRSLRIAADAERPVVRRYTRAARVHEIAASRVADYGGRLLGYSLLTRETARRPGEHRDPVRAPRV